GLGVERGGGAAGRVLGFGLERRGAVFDRILGLVELLGDVLLGPRRAGGEGGQSGDEEGKLHRGLPFAGINRGALNMFPPRPSFPRSRESGCPSSRPSRLRVKQAADFSREEREGRRQGSWIPAFAGRTKVAAGLGKWGASVARCSPYRRSPLLLPGAA